MSIPGSEAVGQLAVTRGPNIRDMELARLETVLGGHAPKARATRLAFRRQRAAGE